MFRKFAGLFTENRYCYLLQGGALFIVARFPQKGTS
jgi:hypothetical protein